MDRTEQMEIQDLLASGVKKMIFPNIKNTKIFNNIKPNKEYSVKNIEFYFKDDTGEIAGIFYRCKG